jgi:hypothetical protein
MHGSLDTIEYFLSVGTGVKPAFLSPKHTFSKTLIKAPKASSSYLNKLEKQTSIRVNEKLLYERWDVSDPDDDDSRRPVERTLWRRQGTLKSIEETTMRYLSLPEIDSSLRGAAKKLVERRRERANTSAWEPFIFGVLYICPEFDCSDRHIKFRDRNELIAHMQSRHHLTSPGPDNVDQIENILNRARIDVDCALDKTGVYRR